MANYPYTQVDCTSEIDSLSIDYYELLRVKDELEDDLHKVNNQIQIILLKIEQARRKQTPPISGEART